jgi:sulfate transport system ATP-binding protein
VLLQERDVTRLSPQKRGVGLVFQNYALFRHMTVAEKIEFGLRVRRVKASERRKRRQEMLKLVALEGMDERLPTQLSGGQQQRVAVARALAHKPEVLLLDEPFGALDAKIREELRRTIRQVQRELGITTVLVTHDQEEAFALADRIGVMNLGRLLEMGRPDELYARPATRFVATFLGAANLLLALQTRNGIQFSANAAYESHVPERRQGSSREHEVVAVVRPEEVEIAANRDVLGSRYLAKGIVEEMVFTGALERLRVRINHRSEEAQLATHSNPGAGAFLEVTRTQHEHRGTPVKPGQAVVIGVRRVHLLPTPLSSFTACGPSGPDAERLSRQPFLVELATRMRTRVATRIEAALCSGGSFSGEATADSGNTAAFAGAAVISAHPQTSRDITCLLERGAGEVLVLPPAAASPQRVLIHWVNEQARPGTLAVSASLLRHVHAEATYVDVRPEETPEGQRPGGMRALLDARSEAQAVHGLEMRTELRFGDAAHELASRLGEWPDTLLILGISNIGDLERFNGLLSGEAGTPPAESGLLATGSNIIAGGTKLLTTSAQVLTGGKPQLASVPYAGGPRWPLLVVYRAANGE